MRDHAADVDGRSPRVEVREELRPGPPGEGYPERRALARDLLDHLEAPQEVLAAALRAGRDAETADADHHGGDAVQAARCRGRVPAELGVEVRVGIDEARRDDAAARVDLPSPACFDLADLHDEAVRDRDVGPPGRRARPVDDGAAADDEIGPHPAATRPAMPTPARDSW